MRPGRAGRGQRLVTRRHAAGRYKITAEQAFAVLARYSQDTNRKLREVAKQVTTTGSLEP